VGLDWPISLLGHLTFSHFCPSQKEEGDLFFLFSLNHHTLAQQAEQFQAAAAAAVPTTAATPAAISQERLGLLPKSTPRYAGRPDENLRQWIRRISLVLEMHQYWPEEHKVMAVGLLLDGDACAWYLDARDYAFRGVPGWAPITTWQQLQQRLTGRFQPAQQEANMLVRLDNIRQEGRTVSEYAAEFHALAAQIGDLPENIRIHRFVHGLKATKAREAVLYQQPQTYEAALSVALLSETANSGARQWQPPQQHHQSQQQRNRPVPMELDAAIKGERPAKRSNSKNICYRCGGKGHIARYCATPEESDKSGSSNTSVKPKQKPLPRSRLANLGDGAEADHSSTESENENGQ
jgi:hypothetical protein